MSVYFLQARPLAQASCCRPRDSGAKGKGKKSGEVFEITPHPLFSCPSVIRGFTRCLGDLRIYDVGRNIFLVCFFSGPTSDQMNLNLGRVGLRICFFIILSLLSPRWFLCKRKFENLCSSKMSSSLRVGKVDSYLDFPLCWLGLGFITSWGGSGVSKLWPLEPT